MSEYDLTELIDDVVRPGAAVVIMSARPDGLARAAAAAAGPEGTVSVAAWGAAEAGRLIEALRGADGAPLAVFRAAPGDLAADVVALERRLSEAPPASLGEMDAILAERDRQAATAPILAANTADVVVADRALGLVPAARRESALCDIYRVLRRAGTCILVDVVADDPLPDRLADDPAMPATFSEFGLLCAMEAAKFHGAVIEDFPLAPEATVEGIECRQVVMLAHKGKEGVCRDGLQAVVYRGPWKVVEDDDGHVIRRGERFAVCQKTFANYQREPYAGMFAYIEPAVPVPPPEAPLWDPSRPSRRDPLETKAGARRAGGRPLAPVQPGQAFVARAVWLSAEGDVTRRARVTHRYKGYFESRQEALEMARKVFTDASQHEAESLPVAEAEELLARAGRRASCPLPPA